MPNKTKVRKPNVELLDATLAKVRRAAKRKGKKLDKWDQDTYRNINECGTAMCFAGWACQIAGGKWAVNHIDDGTAEFYDYDILFATSHRESGAYKFNGRWVVSAHHRAIRLLGLTSDESSDLFYTENSLGDLTEIVRKIKARA